MAGLYIHIPFCASYCTYCNFYSVKGAAWRERFPEALCREAEIKNDFFKQPGVPLSTLYAGGGTPSVLSEDQFERMVRGVERIFGLDLNSSSSGKQLAEFTIEVNPDDVTPEKAALWRSLGVTRISMGMQAFSDDRLRWMNRRHTVREGREAFRRLREAGFGNISVDLIFGYEGLEEEAWAGDLEAAVSLSAEHISAYQMSVEPGSALSAMVRRGKYRIPAPERCAAQYEVLQRRLNEAGYEQYEISNFARPGYRSRHNSSYWDGSPYLGLGPAAHSYDGKRVRRWNDPGIRAYCAWYDSVSSSGSACSVFRAGSGILPAGAPEGYEILAPEDLFNEAVMLGLRRKEGVSLQYLESLSAEALQSVRPEMDRLLLSGCLAEENGYIKIPSGKWFVADGIIRELFVV